MGSTILSHRERAESQQKNADISKERRKGHVRTAAEVIVLFLTFLAAASMIFIVTRPQPAPVATSATLDGLKLHFGMSRDTLTRTLRLDLCAEQGQFTFAECSLDSASATSADDRPAILSAVVESDLQEVHGQGTFPAGQLLVSASNAGRTAVLLNVSANPGSPEDVPAGQYLGRVVVERSVGPSIIFPIRAELSPRTGGVTGKVLVALAIGAFGGTMLKWIDDSFSPLAAIRRRQRRLDLHLRNYTDELPLGVVRRLDELNFAIRALDSDGVASSLDQVAENQDALLRFATGVERLEREVWLQERIPIGWDSAPPLILEALALEKEYVADLRGRVWPWDRADEVQTSLTQAQRGFQIYTRGIRQYASAQTPEEKERLERLSRELIAHGPENLMDGGDLGDTAKAGGLERPRSPVGEDVNPLFYKVDYADFDREHEHAIPHRNATLWLLDNAWWITLAVIASTVVAFGFQSQFLENAAFEGDRLDYFALATWAFAVQVAGGTVVETLGRLRTAGRT